MGDATLITIYVALVLSGLLINPLKDKWGVALLSLFVPFIGIVGWFRLGKPDSFWARRFYGPDKMARALNRYPREMPGS